MLTFAFTPLLFLVFVPAAVAASDVEEESRALLQHMYAARQKLQSGVVRVRGMRESVDPEDPSRCFRLPLSAEIAFDGGTTRLRYDADVAERVTFTAVDTGTIADSGDTQQPMPDPDVERVVSQLQSVRTPEVYAYYLKITADEPNGGLRAANDVQLFNGDTDAAVGVVHAHYCFDPRSVGLFNFWEFEGQTHLMGYERPDSCHLVCGLDLMMAQLRQWPVVDITREDGLTTLRFWSDMTMIIDESQDFTPLACHHERGEPGVEGTADTVASTVRWEQIGNVRVPTEFVIEVFNWGGVEGTVIRHTFTLDWSRVNEPIPDHDFDFRNFSDVEEQTAVYDNRSEEAVRLGEWTGGQFVACEPAETTIPEALAEPAERRWGNWIIINSLILLFAVVCLIARSLLRPRTYDST